MIMTNVINCFYRVLIYLIIISFNVNCVDSNKKVFIQEIEKYSNRIKEEPKSPSSYNIRGTIYFDAKYYDEALKDFNVAKTMWENAVTYYYISAIYLIKNDMNNALININKSIEIASSIRRHGLRGLCYDFLNDKKKALEDYIIYPISCPLKDKYEYSIIYIRRSLIFYQNKEYSKALTDLLLAVSIDDSIGDLYYLKFLVYTKLKDYVQAKEDLIKAFKKGFNNQNLLQEDIASEEERYKAEIDKLRVKYIEKSEKPNGLVISNRDFILNRFFYGK